MSLDFNTLSLIASSAVLGSLFTAVVGGLVTIRVAARNIRLQHITEERRKWRDRLREIAVRFHTAAVDTDTMRDNRLRVLVMELQLNLNPTDEEDRGIVAVCRAICGTGESHAGLAELADRLALLLKHDWERAKWEAASKRTRWFATPDPPVRMPYADFQQRFPQTGL